MKDTTTIIKEYIRIDKTRQPRGVAVAIKKDGEVFYGYSLLNTTMDKFSKKLGIEIASARALSPKGYKLPDVLEREAMVLNAFNRLEGRALKYFKDLDPSKVRLMPSNVKDKYTEQD